MQYFGSNIVEGVAESWVEAEMSWVEVGARFSNTHKIILDKVDDHVVLYLKLLIESMYRRKCGKCVFKKPLLVVLMHVIGLD